MTFTIESVLMEKKNSLVVKARNKSDKKCALKIFYNISEFRTEKEAHDCLMSHPSLVKGQVIVPLLFNESDYLEPRGYKCIATPYF